jgi:hypothetical protein
VVDQRRDRSAIVRAYGIPSSSPAFQRCPLSGHSGPMSSPESASWACSSSADTQTSQASQYPNRVKPKRQLEYWNRCVLAHAVFPLTDQRKYRPGPSVLLPDGLIGTAQRPEKTLGPPSKQAGRSRGARIRRLQRSLVHRSTASAVTAGASPCRVCFTSDRRPHDPALDGLRGTW